MTHGQWTGVAVPRRTVLAATLLLPLAACAAPATEQPTAATTAPAPTAPPLDTAAVAARFADLEGRFAARLGVYAVDAGGGRELAHRADERFAMCSTFKTLAAAAVLDRTPPEHLGTRVHWTTADVAPYSPVSQQHVADGMTIRELCDAAIRYSDNTAANLLLEELGGPEEITTFARSLGDTVTRLDRFEPELNTAVPGDERDTTSPRAIAGTYRALVLGDRLEPADRDLLTGWLVGNTTGGARIRAGVPAGWRVGDKTGTGGYATANDVAVVWPPDRAPIVVAVLTSKAAADADADDALLAEAATLVADAFAGPPSGSS
ncbi:class A beta-lactamase [Pseudonocardia nigra]|uniref:class A beta-lactamase n=1 Tax=Pseudonocardia nigra TaxID=1921578 RepID=UPI001C5D43EC|nr:class A beta-lactamase [Pseudonocardia nigra]